jgi:hypothetical protein
LGHHYTIPPLGGGGVLSWQPWRSEWGWEEGDRGQMGGVTERMGWVSLGPWERQVFLWEEAHGNSQNHGTSFILLTGGNLLISLRGRITKISGETLLLLLLGIDNKKHILKAYYVFLLEN